MKKPDSKLGRRLSINVSVLFCSLFFCANLNAQTNCISSPANLVSWWRGRGNALDQAGVNNGVLAGNTSYGAGKVGVGFVFDGSGDAVQLGNPASLQLQDFTIEAWVK